MKIAKYVLVAALGVGLTNCASIANVGNWCQEQPYVCAGATLAVFAGAVYAATRGHHDPVPGGAGSIYPGPAELPSDARLKRDIRFVQTLGNGVHLYAFRYWNDTRVFTGVLAQDLLKDERFRHAVHQTPSGYYVVDFPALDLQIVGASDQYLEAARHALEAAESKGAD